MGRRLVTLLVFSVVAGAALFLLRVVLAGPDQTAAPTAEDPLPVVLANGEEPRPTFTPIPPPSQEAALISRQRAIDIVLERVGSTVDKASITARLGIAGDANISLHDRDYPVWIIGASGEFKPQSWKCCSPIPTFGKATIYLDALDGKLLHVSLREVTS